VAACQAAVAALFGAIGIWLAARLLAVGWRRIWAASWPALAAVVPMLTAMLAIDAALTSPWPTLLVGTAAGGATYLAVLWTLDRDSILRLRDMALARSAEPVSPGTPAVP
jgi:hypothetical protein